MVRSPGPGAGRRGGGAGGAASRAVRTPPTDTGFIGGGGGGFGAAPGNEALLDGLTGGVRQLRRHDQPQLRPARRQALLATTGRPGPHQRPRETRKLFYLFVS
ncbi:MAG: hypothetical protein ACO3WU_05230, partial [Ilumatobacteraceae bacterium]